MNKFFYLFSFILLSANISCTKEEVSDKEISCSSSPVFIATIDNSDSKTTIYTVEGKVSWESDDEITITDGTNTATYSISKIDDGRATFVKKSGDDLMMSGVTYTATYGTPPSTSQIYSTTVGKLPMSATSTSSSLHFTVNCGLLKISLTKSGESIKSISVTGTPTGGIETTYTLTCDPAQSIDTAKDFYISLPMGIYSSYSFVNSSNVQCVKKAKKDKGTIIAKNTIQLISFSTSLIFDVDYVDLGLSVLWAKFNIGASKPEEYGNYYAWGEIAPQENNPYSWQSYKWHDGSSQQWLKYNGTSVLESCDDAATVNLGPNWRIPFYQEWWELRDHCSWTWINLDGVDGYKVKSEVSGYENNWIFLPAQGAYADGILYQESKQSAYWSSYKESDYSWYFYGYEGGLNWGSMYSYYGMPIRAVYSTSETAGINGIEIDKSHLELTVSESYKLKASVSKEPWAVCDRVFWSSSNPNIVSVGIWGEVTAKAEGSAVISAITAFGSYKATCDVIVKSEDLSLTGASNCYVN